MKKILLVAAAFFITPPSFAQDADGLGEIVVTAQRSSGEYFSDEAPVIGLTRKADFAVQSVIVTSDSRDKDMREREIFGMIENAIKRAPGAGVELAMGDLQLVPLTMTNHRMLSITPWDRPDTGKTYFYIKTRFGDETGNSAQDRLRAFIKNIPPVGRSQMQASGNLTMSIVNPDQYRDDIVRLIAKESLRYAGYFGPEYGVQVTGLNEALSWSQASATEVFLYIPYRFTVAPK